jgi:AcrR family transcriptional regulator
MSDPVSDARMFDAALTVLAQRGYAGATTRRIAEAAGVNEATLFRRFGDKRQLILAAIHADLAQLPQGGLAPSGDLEADLIRVVEYYTNVYQHRDGLVGTLLLEASRDPDVAALLKEPLASLSRLGDVFADQQQTGHLVEEPTDFAVQALLAPLLMVSVLRRVTSSEIPYPDAHTVVERFLSGRRAISRGRQAPKGPKAGRNRRGH